jgi:hypothetical protein
VHKEELVRGPIDFLIVGFEGNKFDGSILKALAGAIDNGIIALVDLSVIVKDEQGNISALSVADLGDSYAVEFVEKYKPDATNISTEDIDEVTELLENNTAAGLLVVEHLWAKPLKQAIVNAGGFLIADGRIHPDAASELIV